MEIHKTKNYNYYEVANDDGTTRLEFHPSWEAQPSIAQKEDIQSQLDFQKEKLEQTNRQITYFQDLLNKFPQYNQDVAPTRIKYIRHQIAYKGR